MSQVALITNSDAVTTPILRYHGSKFRLSPWIACFFTAHRIYVEPFVRVLRDRNAATELLRLCQLTSYARNEFVLARRTLFRSLTGVSELIPQFTARLAEVIIESRPSNESAEGRRRDLR